MKTCTLLFLVRDGEILLAMKKRGFGADRWNGVGGKIDDGEAVEHALVRECQEEIGVTPTAYEKVAVHDFVFPDGMTDMRVHAYICDEWKGEPIETEEMAPQWFKFSEVPYDDMWQDERFWLPDVLAGKRLHGRFTFDDKENLLDSRMHEAAVHDTW
jgi:8-oxo-dGTP diphosphatase